MYHINQLNFIYKIKSINILLNSIYFFTEQFNLFIELSPFCLIFLILKKILSLHIKHLYFIILFTCGNLNNITNLWQIMILAEFYNKKRILLKFKAY